MAAELRERLGLPKSSCFTLMETLKSAGYVYWVGRDQGYYPTQKWFNLSRAVSESDPVLLVVSPHLSALRNATGETVMFSKLDGLRLLYLATSESPKIVRFAASAGQHRPLHPAAAGRALLAALPPDERQALISRMTLTRYTAATPVSAQKLNALIQKESAQGWHVNLGGYAEDTATVAVGLTIGLENYALAVGGPLNRIEGCIPKIAKALTRHAREIGLQSLGARRT